MSTSLRISMNDRELLAIMAAILAARSRVTDVKDMAEAFVGEAAALLNEVDRYVAEREIVREQLYQKEEPLP